MRSQCIRSLFDIYAGYAPDVFWRWFVVYKRTFSRLCCKWRTKMLAAKWLIVLKHRSIRCTYVYLYHVISNTASCPRVLWASWWTVQVRHNQHSRRRQHSEKSGACLLRQMILPPFAHEAMIFRFFQNWIVFSLLGILGGSFSSLVVRQFFPTPQHFNAYWCLLFIIIIFNIFVITIISGCAHPFMSDHEEQKFKHSFHDILLPASRQKTWPHFFFWIYCVSKCWEPISWLTRVRHRYA